MIQPSNGFYHPASEDDIIPLIQYAAKNKLQVRVCGAGQSTSQAVYTDGYSPGNDSLQDTANINILLDKMAMVTIDTASRQATVQAGCHLGYDPYDPADASTLINGLFYQLQQKGLAIPNMADAIHQTVAGYIATGSSGGSVEHSFFEWIVAITLIDGTGTQKVFKKPSPDNPADPFYGVGVSLGLLGVITEVTFQCIDAFNVIGQQHIDPDSQAPVVDLFDSGTGGRPSLQSFLSSTEFTRLLWWPFPTVRRLITWQARTMQPADYNTQTGTPAAFIPKPYKDLFFTVGGSELPAEGMADAFFTMIGTWPQPLRDLLGNSTLTDRMEYFIEVIWPFMLPLLLDVYLPCDGTHTPQQFWDTWLDGLPMDAREYSNKLFPALHTEFWVPLDQCEKVMDVLKYYYDNTYFKVGDLKNRNATNGCYTIELAGAKSSSFWMNPAYGQDSFRVNIFWFGNNTGNVMDYFQQFWDLFKKSGIDFRMHWGYLLPPPSGDEGAAYLQKQYPMWKQFMTLRSDMDPDNIFLNTYWKTQLGIDV
jgi:hypothetical protein